MTPWGRGILAAFDRGLASEDVAVKVRTATAMLDRYLGKPVTPTQEHEPGTQDLLELRRIIGTLEPSERLAYPRGLRDEEER